MASVLDMVLAVMRTLYLKRYLEIELVSLHQITGDTVYNLMKIGELETDKEDRPVDPPVINSVEVSTVTISSTAAILVLGIEFTYRLCSGYVCESI